MTTIQFNLEDAVHLTDMYFGSEYCQEECFAYQVSCPSSYFLIEKILKAFGYKIITEDETDEGEIITYTDLPMSVIKRN